MPRHQPPSEISGSWITTDTSSSISTQADQTTRSSAKTDAASTATLPIPASAQPKQGKTPRQPKRTPLEDYFHEQSKLFSALQKRYDAFQARAAEERGKKNKNKRKGKVTARGQETVKPSKEPETTRVQTSVKGKEKANK